MKTDRILIIGNGPSAGVLAGVGFANLSPSIDTFGMGAAYRYYREVGWWPTYYALGDRKVAFSHRQALRDVVEDPEVGTERFFLAWPVSDSSRLEVIDHTSTGDFCLKKAAELGYTQIYLIGIEGDYVEELPESRPLTSYEYFELGFDELELSANDRSSLRIIHTDPIDNPNYFFPTYQMRGDVYSLPQSHRHRERWSSAAALVGGGRAQVVNLSPTSRIADVPKSSIVRMAQELLADPDDLLASMNADWLRRAELNTPTGATSMWVGPFDRSERKRVDESAAIRQLFTAGALTTSLMPTMIDVGACKGGAFRDFARESWDLEVPTEICSISAISWCR